MAQPLDEKIETAEDFEARGGKVTRLQPQQKPRRRRQDLSPQVIRRRRLPPGYEHEPAQRWEKLLIKMGLPGLDPMAIRANSGFRHEPHQVWGTLALARQRDGQKLPEEIRALLVYMATGDRDARKVVFAELFLLLMIRCADEDWDCRKPGTIEMMTQVLIRDIADPHQYRHLSEKRWSVLLGLADQRDWRRRWQGRYGRARSLVAKWASDGIDALERACA